MEKVLLIDRQGDKWIFNCDGKGRLCYSKNGENEQILINNAKQDFDIITDNDGIFHLIIQTQDGNLIYLIYDFENWKKYTVLRSRSEHISMTGFKLFYLNGKTHCFYHLNSNGKIMLVHHIFTASNPSVTPEVISYTAPGKDFSCCIDENGDIHIFYFDENSVFRYKNFLSDKYSECTLPTEDEIKSISSISGNGIHLLYTARMKSYYTLIYYNIKNNERKIISFGDNNISSTCIYTHENSIYIQWRERTRYYQCMSDDGGHSFKKPAFIPESKSKHPEAIRIRLKSNPSSSKIDRCIALTGNNTIDILSAEKCVGLLKPVNTTGKNHKEKETDYNIIDGAFSDDIKMLKSKIHENEKELIRLNAIVNTLSDKISNLTKNGIASCEPLPQKLDENKLGEINTENYELFKNTDIDNVEFDNPTTF